MAGIQCNTDQHETAITTKALACAIMFLQSYPELTQFVVNETSYQFDMQSLIMDAKRLALKETVQDIRKEFDTNGISSEVCDENKECFVPTLKHHPSEDEQTDVGRSKVEEQDNESAECDVLQDITNHAKENSRRNLRRNKSKNISHPEHCVFCLNNGATREEYESHHCKDEWGNVTCPVLQKFVCSRCNATGTNAHTAKYCPQKPIITPEACVAIEKRWQQKRRRRPYVPNGTNVQTKPIAETKAPSRLRM